MLFDAHGDPVKANESDISQEQENADSSEKATSDKQPLQRQRRQRPPLRVIVEMSEGDAKQQKATSQRDYAFQWESLRVQRYLFYATLAAFGAAAYYAWTAKETLKEIHLQNVAQQRADFSVTVDQSYTGPDRLAIDITNHGHVTGTLISYQIIYGQKISYGASFTRQHTETVKEAIAADSVYILGISLPSTPTFAPTRHGEWYVHTECYLTYDDGFGNEGVLRACLQLEPTTRVWNVSCGWINSVDLSRDSKSENKK